MKERLKNNKGFPLVEIIVVLVILAILVGLIVLSIVIPMFDMYKQID